MDYFGEDTSKLVPRLNCCDNCANGPNGNTRESSSLVCDTAARNIVDMFFGDCVFCDHEHNYDSDDYDGSYFEEIDPSCSDEDEQESDTDNA